MSKKQNKMVDILAEVQAEPVVLSNSNEVEAKLNPLRVAVAEAQSVVYGAERALAIGYNEVFAFDWFEVEYREVSDNAKALNPEKKKLFELLKAKGHTNPATVWARIRKYGHEERYPASEELNTGGADGVEELEQGESATSRERSPKLRFVEELSALYKFGMRQENLANDVNEALKCVTMGLQFLGVDVNLISK